MKILLTIALLLIGNAAAAGCYCACTNGVNQPICSSTIDLPPICGPAICPIVPPSITPIEPLRIPPLGTQTCHQQQVWDSSQNKYVWKSICR